MQRKKIADACKKKKVNSMLKKRDSTTFSAHDVSNEKKQRK